MMDHHDVLRYELEHPDGFLLKLRAMEGFDEAAFSRFIRALKALREEWKGQTHIPKDLVQLIFWSGPAIEACSHLYAEPEAEKIRLRAMEVVDLLFEVFSVDD